MDVARAYGARATEYAEALGSIEVTAAPDRELVARWARTVTGTVVDAGCGPGHWTAYLATLGCDVVGLDPAPEFVDISRRRHPSLTFEQGRVEELPTRGVTYGGVLAWYSVIHHEPDAVPDFLAAIRTALSPSGTALLGFFTGEQVTPFDHAVTTAYLWPPDRMGALLEAAGFEVLSTERRQDSGVRPHGAITARVAATRVRG